MDIAKLIHARINDGRRVSDGDALAAADEIELLRKRLADCVAWMDTREKMVPGMSRICDMGRDALTKSE